MTNDKNKKEEQKQFVGVLTPRLQKMLQDALCEYDLLDDNEATSHLLEIAKEVNYPLVYVLLGRIYEREFGISKDSDVSKKYYEQARAYKNWFESSKIKTKEEHWAAGMYYCYAYQPIDDLQGSASSHGSKAIQHFRSAAALGHIRAKFDWGVCYVRGIGVDINQETQKKALDLWTQAANKGCASAQFNLGSTAERNYEESNNEEFAAMAEYYYQQVAEEESPVAQYRLGEFYRKRGNYKMAVHWYTRGANGHGHSDCQYRLVDCYLKGLGVERSYRRAIAYCRYAADQEHEMAISIIEKLKNAAKANDPYSQWVMGLYYAGTGEFSCSPEDAKESVKWFKNAAENGYANAQYNLGVCYKDGEGVQEDEQAAREWFQRAASQSNAAANYMLGLFYQQGRGGLKQDDKEAAKCFLSAAENNVDAQYNLGVCYKDGKGVKQDNKESLKYFQRAAEEGDRRAQCTLSYYYETEEIGLRKDDSQAFKWHKLLAEQQDRWGQMVMGRCYQNGRFGLPQNDVEAVAWFQRAANWGFGTGVGEAQFHLAEYYQKGKGGLPQSNSEAIKLYTKAAKLGNVKASEALAILIPAIPKEKVEEIKDGPGKRKREPEAPATTPDNEAATPISNSSCLNSVGKFKKPKADKNRPEKLKEEAKTDKSSLTTSPPPSSSGKK
jgi:hypothetical protein